MSASADLLFDRGLPTANINTGNANQANVAWADSESSPSGPFYLPGDDFTLSGSGAYQVTDIRVWTTDPTAGLSLLGGVAGTTIGTISSSYTATPVTYANGQGYQTQSGSFLQIYQLDFSVNLALNGGQTFQFFLNGPPSLYGDGTCERILARIERSLERISARGSKWAVPVARTRRHRFNLVFG